MHLNDIERLFYNCVTMDREILILAGAIFGLFGWQSMPNWRQALRIAPALALLLSALTGFVRIQLPTYVLPVLLGMGAVIAALQLTRWGGSSTTRRRRS